ncbi:MAG: 16S rRNA (guanine(527)-N(7))-methyltransferase RsmG [Holosporales bacterium]
MAKSFAVRWNKPLVTSKLDLYHRELEHWASKTSLISKSQRQNINDQLIDSEALIPWLHGTRLKIADVGSGNGLPGVVLACALPKNQYTFIESNHKKAAFLQHLTQKLALPVTVRCARVEKMPRMEVDYFTAKAFAPLPRLLELLDPIAPENRRLLLLKGKNINTEIEEARRQWTFFALEVTATATGSFIVAIRGWKRG